MAFAKGCIVRVCGLQRRPDLNGTIGLVVNEGNVWDAQHRLTVLTIPQRKLLVVRPINLQHQSDKSITVCVSCREDFWSWATHGGYAGWQKVSQNKYACPSCIPDSGTPTCSAWATSSTGVSSVWATSTAGVRGTHIAMGGGAQEGGDKSEESAVPPTAEPFSTRISKAVQTLAQALETAFAAPQSRPHWMLEPTDESLRHAGRYDPADGCGLAEETDWGNFSGSVLMLAMLDERYLPKGARPLSIFGAGLLEMGTAVPRSGRGPDNRRTNALEALLNYLQPFPQATALRQLLKDTWRLLRLGVACGGVTNNLPHECVHQVLACKDENLPTDGITDEEVINFEKVMHAVGPEAQKRLRELPVGEASKATISTVVGCSPTSRTVSLLQQAIFQCALEGAGDHCGSLLFLFFASTRRVCKPPASLAAEAAKVQETPLLLWLQRRRVEVPMREARFRVWKQLLLDSHPDKLHACQEYDRLALAVRCSFLRTAKGWFLGCDAISSTSSSSSSVLFRRHHENGCAPSTCKMPLVEI